MGGQPGGFACATAHNAAVSTARHGQPAATVRGNAARKIRADVEAADPGHPWPA